MIFEHPTLRRRVTVRWTARLWFFLFGPFYLAYLGLWPFAIADGVLWVLGLIFPAVFWGTALPLLLLAVHAPWFLRWAFPQLGWREVRAS
jgi:hypothetical protein